MIVWRSTKSRTTTESSWGRDLRVPTYGRLREERQVIGYASATGDGSEPQLHFERRLGTEPVNPKPDLVASK
jgi:hypothetical protein